ncbi:MAG: chorismate synthase [Dehalococcoidales bacterium]|nr:chorismate synthase [Dehalococcoidales bacterium]
MSNSLGNLFTVTSFGESHGKLIGMIIDGCPAGLSISEADIQQELDRRKPGSNIASTPRNEEDKIEILSGVLNRKTTGAPICLAILNKDACSGDYDETRSILRPGHADFTSYIKYGGFGDYRGGGRFSGRITAGFVAAGAVARKLLKETGIEIIAHTIEIGGISAEVQDIDTIRRNVNTNPLRCADMEATSKMIDAIEQVKAQGDSLGGIIEGIATGVPAGLGEPVFDNLDGELAKALFAIPAVKGVEFGAGFVAACLTGSQNNDSFDIEDGKIITTSNNAGGILGGISNGMPLVIRVAIKPAPSISKPQATVDVKQMTKTQLKIKGRHDACIVPRAVVVVEAMMAITLCDLALRAGLLPGIIK